MHALLLALAAISGDLSHEAIHEAKRDKPWVHQRTRLHLMQKSEDSLLEQSPLLWGYELAVFAQHDSALDRNERSEFQVENILLRGYREQWNARIGWQTVHWGETLGPSLIDLINPRDLRDQAYWLRADRKLAVPLLLAGWAGDSLALEAWLDPWAPQSILPESWQGLRLSQADKRGGAEYGLRAGDRIGGWDMKIYLMRHRSRLPTLTLNPATSQASVQAHFPWQTSLGVTLSQAWESLVLRSELVHASTDDLPAENLLDFARNQAVVGLDANWGAHFFWASELRYNQQESADSEERELMWVIAQARWMFFGERLRPLIYGMHRLQGTEAYQRYEISSSLTTACDLALAWEDYQSSRNGYFRRLGAHDRLNITLRWEF